MEKEWQFAGSSREKEAFEIREVNVWDRDWQVVPGQKAHIHDPVYGKGFVFRVYTILDGEENIEFAAGEFSSGEWGFCTRE
jgi:hypothetical protein